MGKGSAASILARANRRVSNLRNLARSNPTRLVPSRNGYVQARTALRNAERDRSAALDNYISSQRGR